MAELGKMTPLGADTLGEEPFKSIAKLGIKFWRIFWPNRLKFWRIFWPNRFVFWRRFWRTFWRTFWRNLVHSLAHILAQIWRGLVSVGGEGLSCVGNACGWVGEKGVITTCLLGFSTDSVGGTMYLYDWLLSITHSFTFCCIIHHAPGLLHRPCTCACVIRIW